MNHQSQPHNIEQQQQLNRRWFLEQCGVGLGAIALSSMMQQESQAASIKKQQQKTHFKAKAKSAIFLFMAGGPSHMELLDNKPQLSKFDGTLPPKELLKDYRAAFIDPNSKLLGPKFKYAKYGKCGAEVSEVLPHLAKIVDEIAIVKSMKTTAFNHAPAQVKFHTGNSLFGKPSMGAWLNYGLGSESKDLPGFVVMSSGKKGPSGGNSCWGSGYLPTKYQGVQFRGGKEPVMYLANPKGIDNKMQRDSLDVIKSLNQQRLSIVGDPEIATRINSYEMAFRMQSAAPEVTDISKEPKHILEMYGAEPGKDTYANNCLLARRLIERGVRYVELFHESWDQHGGLVNGIKKNCKDTDKASAALVTDLKQRGLLDETMVVWGGEFGRTPMVQGGNDGRDHHPNAFTMWMAGGGFKGGTTYGTTDDFGFNVVDNIVNTYDFHATMLHNLGLDFRKLNHRFQGLDQSLTGIEPARVIKEILA